MNIEISIGIESDTTILLIGRILYMRVGEVAVLKFFKWDIYQRVGNICAVFGVVIGASKMEED